MAEEELSPTGSSNPAGVPAGDLATEGGAATGAEAGLVDELENGASNGQFEAFPEPLELPDSDNENNYEQLARANAAGRRASLKQTAAQNEATDTDDEETSETTARDTNDFAGGGRDALTEDVDEDEKSQTSDEEAEEETETEEGIESTEQAVDEDEGEEETEEEDRPPELTENEQRLEASRLAAKQYATANVVGLARTAEQQLVRETQKVADDPLQAVVKWFVVVLVVLGCGGGCFIIMVAAIIAPFYLLVRQLTG